MDEEQKIAAIKKLKLEQKRLRNVQNPSVKDRKRQEQRQELKQEYWKLVKESR